MNDLTKEQTIQLLWPWTKWFVPVSMILWVITSIFFTLTLFSIKPPALWWVNALASVGFWGLSHRAFTYLAGIVLAIVMSVTGNGKSFMQVVKGEVTATARNMKGMN